MVTVQTNSQAARKNGFHSRSPDWCATNLKVKLLCSARCEAEAQAPGPVPSASSHLDVIPISGEVRS